MPPTKFPAPNRWLLDHNIPAALGGWLKTQGIEAETAAERGWKEFSDTRLVRAAEKEFGAVLTRDRRFVDSARHALIRSSLSVVFVRLSQAPADEFVQAFAKAWSKRPIDILAGEQLQWP